MFGGISTTLKQFSNELRPIDETKLGIVYVSLLQFLNAKSEISLNSKSVMNVSKPTHPSKKPSGIF